MAKTKLPDAFKDLIEMQLVHDEEVLWVGMPQPLNLLRRSVLTNPIPIGMFILMWLFESSSSPPQTGTIFDYFRVLIFVVILGPVIWEYFKQLRHIYVVTNQRAIIISRWLTTDIQSYTPHKITFLKVRYHTGTYGDVIFDREILKKEGWNSYKTFLTPVIEIGFFAVEDAAKVEALLLDTLVNLSEEEKSKPKNSHWD